MAFHPYPRVVPSVFNRSGFGPPRGLTPASACPWIAHPASRPRRATERPVQTRFRCGSVFLNLAARRDSQAHSTKGTPSRDWPAPAACRRTVSGAVSLPSRGAFHLSLAVLVRYRSSESVQPWRAVPPDSRRIPRVRRYSGPASRGGLSFAYGAFTLFRRPSHAVPLDSPFLTAPRLRSAGSCGPATPAPQRLRAVTRARVWAGALSLAATRAISVDFSSSGYLDVSVPPVASSRAMCSPAGSRAWPLLGSPIRESPDRRPFAPPRGLSQLAAPFIGFRRLGIRRAPLVSCLPGGSLPPVRKLLRVIAPGRPRGRVVLENIGRPEASYRDLLVRSCSIRDLDAVTRIGGSPGAVRPPPKNSFTIRFVVAHVEILLASNAMRLSRCPRRAPWRTDAEMPDGRGRAPFLFQVSLERR